MIIQIRSRVDTENGIALPHFLQICTVKPSELRTAEITVADILGIRIAEIVQTDAINRIVSYHVHDGLHLESPHLGLSRIGPANGLSLLVHHRPVRMLPQQSSQYSFALWKDTELGIYLQPHFPGRIHRYPQRIPIGKQPGLAEGTGVVRASLRVQS